MARERLSPRFFAGEEQGVAGRLVYHALDLAVAPDAGGLGDIGDRFAISAFAAGIQHAVARGENHLAAHDGDRLEIPAQGGQPEAEALDYAMRGGVELVDDGLLVVVREDPADAVDGEPADLLQRLRQLPEVGRWCGEVVLRKGRRRRGRLQGRHRCWRRHGKRQERASKVQPHRTASIWPVCGSRSAGAAMLISHQSRASAWVHW